jgi:hypothetical protein
MLGYFRWQREIAAAMSAIRQLIEDLAEAERDGGCEVALALLKRVGRQHRDIETPDAHGVRITMPLPKHDFDVALVKHTNRNCRVTITGLPRYAGFALSCALPPRTFLTDLELDSATGVSWRARKLLMAIRQEQRLSGGHCGSLVERHWAAAPPLRADQRSTR